jgi:hypothetical protein
MRDLVDPVICRCRKHRQLACQEEAFVACFPLNVLMVHSSMLAITTDGEHLTCGGFSIGETVCFGNLEFITNCFGSRSLPLKGNDSGTVFVGTACSGSPSWHAILEDSTDEFYTASSREGSSSFPISWRRSMVTPPVPITTTQRLEDAPTPQTIATVLLRTIVP